MQDAAPLPNEEEYQTTPAKPAAAPSSGPEAAPLPGEQEGEYSAKPESSPGRGWAQALEDVSGLVNPGAGLMQHARGRVTPGAQFWGSAAEAVPIVGNLPKRGYEWAAGKFHDLTGKGNTEEQQRAADEEYQRQLNKEYPWTGALGAGTGIGATIGATAPLGAPALFTGTRLGAGIGRAAWQALLGGGTGALTGFTTGEDLGNRLRRARDLGILGTGFGLIGSMGGEVIGHLLGREVTAAVQQAAHETGVSPYAKAASQKEAIEQAIGAPGVEPVRPTGNAIYGEGGLNEKVHQQVTQHFEDMENAAVAMKQQALTKGAMVSPDAFAALRQKMAGALADEGIDINDIAKLPTTAKARRAMYLFDRLETSANQAAQSGKEINLAQIEKTHQDINAVGKSPGGYDPVVGILQKNYNQWLQDTVDAHLFSGDPSAVQDLLQWRKMYAGFKDAIGGENALANVLRKSATPETIANYFDNVTKLGAGQEGAKLASSLKPIVGDHEWELLKGFTLGKFVSSEHGGELTGTQLANRLQTLLDAPVSKVLFDSDQTRQWQSLVTVLRSLPKTNPLGTNASLVLGGIVGGEAAAEVGFEAITEAIRDREGVFNPYKLAATVGYRTATALLLAKFGPGIIRGMGPALAATPAVVGTSAIANTPSLSNIIGHAHGGSVRRALSVARQQIAPR